MTAHQNVLPFLPPTSRMKMPAVITSRHQHDHREGRTNRPFVACAVEEAADRFGEQHGGRTTEQHGGRKNADAGQEHQRTTRHDAVPGQRQDNPAEAGERPCAEIGGSVEQMRRNLLDRRVKRQQHIEADQIDQTKTKRERGVEHRYRPIDKADLAQEDIDRAAIGEKHDDRKGADQFARPERHQQEQAGPLSRPSRPHDLRDVIGDGIDNDQRQGRRRRRKDEAPDQRREIKRLTERRSRSWSSVKCDSTPSLDRDRCDKMLIFSIWIDRPDMDHDQPDHRHHGQKQHAAEPRFHGSAQRISIEAGIGDLRHAGSNTAAWAQRAGRILRQSCCYSPSTYLGWRSQLLSRCRPRPVIERS